MAEKANQGYNGILQVKLKCSLKGLYVCVHVCVCIYVSMDPRGLIQIKWMNEYHGFLQADS